MVVSGGGGSGTRLLKIYQHFFLKFIETNKFNPKQK